MKYRLPQLFMQVCDIASGDAIEHCGRIEREEHRAMLRTESFSTDDSGRLARLFTENLTIDERALLIRLYTGVRRQCTIALADLGRMFREARIAEAYGNHNDDQTKTIETK